MKNMRGAKTVLTDHYEGFSPADEKKMRKLRPGFLSFEGNSSSFADEGASQLTYGMTIRNDTDKAVKIAICPGYYDKAVDVRDSNGAGVDAILADGSFFTDVDGKMVFATGDPTKLTELLAFVRRNPTRFTGLRISVDDASQLAQNFGIRYLSPFRSLGDDRIVPSTYKSPGQSNEKVVEVPLENFQMDDQTVITYTVGKGREVVLTWFVGAINNAAAALDYAAKESQAYIKNVAK